METVQPLIDQTAASVMDNHPLGRNGHPLNKHDLVKTRTSSLILSKHNNKIKLPDGSDVPGNLIVDRPLYTQVTFDADNTLRERKGKPVKQKARETVKSACECNPKCFRDFLYARLPFIHTMKNYEWKDWLASDVIAGLTVGIMHIPQGMAYALLTTLPPYYGLYVSFFPVLIYFFLGTSRHISIGTFAVISLMVGSAVEKQMSNFKPTGVVNGTMVNGTNTTATPGGVSVEKQEEMFRVTVALAVTLMGGIIQLIMGILRLGFLTIYLSDSLTVGFTTGCACHVFTSQVKHIFGISVKRYSGAFKLIYTYIDFFKNIGKTNLAAIITGAICIICLIIVKEFINPRVKKKIKAPVPIELFLIIVGTLASHFGKLNEKFNLSTVGQIPVGFPAPRAPVPQQMLNTAPDAIAIAIVGFAISVSMVKLFSKKHNYEVDANQELFAYGISNAVSSIFNCFMSCASLSRSLVQENVGGKTELASIVSSILVLIVIVAIGPLFQALPKAVLAAIIVVALKGMFMQFKELPRLFKISKIDFLIWVVTFLGTVLLDVDIGLIVGVGFSLLTVIARTSRVHTVVLGRVPHTDIYKNIKVYTSAQQIPGIKIFRFESSLYYANKEYFKDQLYSRTECNPRQVAILWAKLKKKHLAEKKKLENEEKKRAKKLQKMGEMMSPSSVVSATITGDVQADPGPELPPADIHHVIIDCSTMGYIDYAGVSVLSQVIAEYKEINVHVLLTNCKSKVRHMLESAGFFDKIDRNQLMMSIHDAVVSALEKHDALSLEELQKDPIPLESRGMSFTEDDLDENDDRRPPIIANSNTNIHLQEYNKKM